MAPVQGCWMLTIPGGIVLAPPDLEPWLLPPDWEVSLGLPLPERLPKRGLPFFWPPPGGAAPMAAGVLGRLGCGRGRRRLAGGGEEGGGGVEEQC